MAATEAVRRQRPDILVEGEVQLDVGIVPEISARKAPESSIAGRANVLIFPDLQAGNIGYKLVERFANSLARGSTSRRTIFPAAAAPTTCTGSRR